MDDYQKNNNFIFENHTLAQKRVRTGIVKKEDRWVIAAHDKTDLGKLLEALKATYIENGTHELFKVSGLDVIFTERGATKILDHRNEHEIESNPEWLRYDQLTSPRIDQKFHAYDSKAQFYPINGYTAIDYVGRNSSINPDPEEKDIAKFHLSIHRDDIPKAWNAIADYLVDNEMLCKVITPKKLETAASKELKPIVLYVTRKNIKDTDRWQQTLTDIETILVANDVRPGRGYESDRPVEGSRFFHLRYGNTVYDRETRTPTKWDDDLQVLNGGVDSFADLKINVTEEEAKRFQAQAASRPRGTRERHG